jgi:glycosyltransferase 2 family protein
VLCAGLLFVLLRLRSLWQDSHFDFAGVNWPLVVASAVFSAFAVVATGFVWIAILRRLGVTVERWFVALFFQAQLGKYIPGSIWQYAGRAALARDRGVAVRVVMVSVTVELCAVVAAAGVVSTLLGGIRGAIGGSVIVLIGVVIANSSRLRSGIRKLATRAFALHGAAAQLLRSFGVAAALYVPVWLVLGLSFWLLARGLFGAPLAELPYDTGAFAVAYVVGLAAVFAPSGLGVREGILVALLSGRLATADAVVLAAASRLVLTLVDVAAAVVAVLVVRCFSKDSAAIATTEPNT